MATTKRRASEREGIAVDLTAPGMRDLMTEQSIVKGGWATFYTGTAAQFSALGIPVSSLPPAGKRRRLQVSGMPASIESKGAAFELTLHWGMSHPARKDAAHPALCELSRMLHIAICYWSETGERDDLNRRTDEVPTAKLIACPQAVDYRLPPARRFRFGPGVQRRIWGLQSQMYMLIRTAEIFPMEPTASPAGVAQGNVVPLRRKAR